MANKTKMVLFSVFIAVFMFIALCYIGELQYKEGKVFEVYSSPKAGGPIFETVRDGVEAIPPLRVVVPDMFSSHSPKATVVERSNVYIKTVGDALPVTDNESVERDETTSREHPAVQFFREFYSHGGRVFVCSSLKHHWYGDADPLDSDSYENYESGVFATEKAANKFMDDYYDRHKNAAGCKDDRGGLHLMSIVTIVW